MSSQVKICNIALTTYLGKQTITDIDERSATAEQCGIHYDETRREIISEHDWSFCTKRERMALLANNDRDEWAYKYSMPAGLVAIRWANTPEAAKAAMADRRINDEARYVEGRFIYSDLRDSFIEYVFDNDDPTTYSPKFVQAFAALLASKMALPLTETQSKATAALDAYEILLDEAKVQDIRLSPPILVYKSTDWTEVR